MFTDTLGYTTAVRTMFRNSQLLRRSRESVREEQTDSERAVAVLADPNQTEAGMLRAVLEKHDFRVIEASEADAAVDLATRHAARLVVASMDMPKVDGYQLFQRLRQQQGLEGIPFILITPQGAFPDKLIGHETFASDYVQRPVNLAEFENRLNAVMRARAAERRPEAATVSETIPRASPRPQKGSAEPSPAWSEIDTMLAEFRAGTPETPDSVPPSSATQKVEIATPAAVAASDAAAERVEAELLGTDFDAEALNREYLAQHEIREETAKLYKEACDFLLTSIVRAERGDGIDIESGHEIAKRTVELLNTEIGLILLATDRTTQFSLVQHSVNVAILGTRIARELDFPDNRLVRLCLAGILHDIGSVKLPKKFLVKLGVFTPAERAEIQRRPTYSAMLLADIRDFEWLPQIVSQVYERENGRGYPRGLKGKDITEEAKVLGLADVFEACIHHRPHRRAMTGYQALEVLTAEVDTFQERIIKAMLRSLSLYPLNEYVELSTGEIAKVIGMSRDNPLRPIVRVMYSNQGERVDQPRILNLARNSSLWIARALTADELHA